MEYLIDSCPSDKERHGWRVKSDESHSAGAILSVAAVAPCSCSTATSHSEHVGLLFGKEATDGPVPLSSYAYRKVTIHGPVPLASYALRKVAIDGLVPLFSYVQGKLTYRWTGFTNFLGVWESSYRWTGSTIWLCLQESSYRWTGSTIWLCLQGS
jgi:hypothetical protein